MTPQTMDAVEVINVNDMNPLQVYIMEKDSKKFYIFNTADMSVSTNTIECNFNFPHNF